MARGPNKKNISNIVLPSLIILGSLLISGVSALRSSRDVVNNYVSVWEEEVARDLLLKSDARMLKKIRSQIIDIAPDVEPESSHRPSNDSCFGEQIVSVTLYGTPAGELRICRSPSKLFIRTLTSPIFAFGLLIGISFALWLMRRSSREKAARDLTELAVRVAHDIRAPLMALRVAISHTPSPSSESTETRRLIESATERISNIAEDLLNERRVKQNSVSKEKFKNTKSLQESMEELVAEKRLLAAPGTIIDLRISGATIETTPITAYEELDRIISNLIQNAIEAIAPATEQVKTHVVSVDVMESIENLKVTVRDNGVGIPSHILPRLGEVGFSYGKSAGNGVGLSSARQWAQSQGGDLLIRSLMGAGTEVCLTLPRR